LEENEGTFVEEEKIGERLHHHGEFAVNEIVSGQLRIEPSFF